jgi:HK97 gp10 family phage protein
LNPAGLRELDQKLAALQNANPGPILRRAVNRGIRPALEQAKATVPVGKEAHKTYKGRLVAPGFARKSLKVKTNVSRDKQAASAILGVASEAFYAIQFIELGTSEIPATPWLQPAFENTAEQQQAALAAELKAGIERAAKK